jgi:glucose dehydrogenase
MQGVMSTREHALGGWPATLFGNAFALMGLMLTMGGIQLVALQGSAYYVLVGLGLIASGILIVNEQRWGVWLYGLVIFGTMMWAVAEVGLSFWGLVPRLLMLSTLGLLLLAALRWMSEQPARASGRSCLLLGGPVLASLVVIAITTMADLEAEAKRSVDREMESVAAAGDGEPPQHLTEASMWGATPIDQLWCRIEFRKRVAGRHDSEGILVDPLNGQLIVNPTMPAPFLSPIKIPCSAPPLRHGTAFDLNSRPMAWQRP